MAGRGGGFQGGGGGRGGFGGDGGAPLKSFIGPDLKAEFEEIVTFLNSYVDRYATDPKEELKYAFLLQRIRNREEKILRVDLEDLMDGNPELVSRVCRNAQRYVRLIERAADDLLDEMQPTVDLEGRKDVRDVLQRQRDLQLDRTRNEDLGIDEADSAATKPNPATKPFPAALVRRYEVRLIPPSSSAANGGFKPLPLRQVKAEQIGALVRVSGIVTRVSDVKPLVEVATYTCDACGFEIYQEVGLKTSFSPIQTCPSKYCMENRLSGKLFMQTRGSKFVKFQEVKLQELPDQVPVGNIPRSLTVTCRGELTRVASPGEMVTVCGVFLPKRYTGFRGMKAGLISDTYLEASDVVKHKESYEKTHADADMERRIDEAAASPDSFNHLARSIAPEIYGHEDVKKALLLMLVGGSTIKLPDGMRIRGDINVCLMGDPGVAKSQLLKYVSTVSPRGVYTTGKGSSGVGLTAAVVRDGMTGEMSLEGGALVLADKGICCIDEFDKMDDYDRTAIHEVMEQQTVSIAKAGITTTLNARCAVLAAANPLYGRYNRRRTMAENIHLPNSLLSRFDLLFLILDVQDVDGDTALARHITYVHKHSRNPELGFTPHDPAFLKHYIAAARSFNPFVPPELSSYIVEAYVEMRQQDGRGANSELGDQAAMTARALLSILRLSQALAKLRFSDSVQVEDLEEAIRLTHMSKASLADVSTDKDKAAALGDDSSRIFGVLRDAAVAANATSLDLRSVEAAVVRLGFSQQAFFECLEEYTDLNVILVDAARTRIDFIG